MKLINVDVNVALVIVERVERCVFLIALGCGHVQLTGSVAHWQTHMVFRGKGSCETW